MNRNPQRYTWRVMVATATLMAASGIVRSVTGQTGQSPPRTAAYLQQLAAVVDGYSGGGPVWVVMCDTTSPYEVIGAFPTESQANEAAHNARGTSGRTCWVDGPYTSDPSFRNLTTTYGAVCKKGWDSQCLSDTSAVLSVTDVQTITMTTTLRSGQTIVESFRPQNVEAIFFTMSAVDRMLIPYYVRLYGVEWAARQRQELARRAQAISR